MKARAKNTTYVVGGSAGSEALQQIAGRLGYVTLRGAEAGRGSISGMLRGMIAGEVIVIPKDVTAGLTHLAHELGYLGVSGGPHVLGMLQDIASEHLELRLGLAATWFNAEVTAGRQPTEQEIDAMRRVQAMLPKVISWLIDQQMAIPVEKPAPIDDQPLTPARARAKIAELEQGV